MCVWLPESVPSIKQDIASKHSQLGSHLSASQAQHSWRCPHDLSPRLGRLAFLLSPRGNTAPQLGHLSTELLVTHQAELLLPPHWKGSAVQGPVSCPSLHNTARSQGEKYPTLNQKPPETVLFFQKELKPVVPRGLPGAGQSLCPVLTNPHNQATQLRVQSCLCSVRGGGG